MHFPAREQRSEIHAYSPIPLLLLVMGKDWGGGSGIMTLKQQVSPQNDPRVTLSGELDLKSLK